MSLYDTYVLPAVIDRACSMPAVMEARRDVVPQCQGAVLEVGMGSGINLPLYDASKVDYIWGLEPSEGMRRKAQKNLAASALDVRWLDLPGEKIPLADNSVDTVLLTFTLCTIPDWRSALAQMHRVLKPDGQLLFCEHGLSEEPAVARWQNRITPVWKRFAGGCHLNRPIAELLQEGHFTIDQLERRYLEKAPRIAGYVYSGSAHKRVAD